MPCFVSYLTQIRRTVSINGFQHSKIAKNHSRISYISFLVTFEFAYGPFVFIPLDHAKFLYHGRVTALGHENF